MGFNSASKGLRIGTATGVYRNSNEFKPHPQFVLEIQFNIIIPSSPMERQKVT